MCRTFSKIQPANQWGWSEVLANKTNYLLELLLWQNSATKNKAQHKRNKPKPFMPDFLKAIQPPGEINKDAEAMTTDDVKSWLSAPRG